MACTELTVFLSTPSARRATLKAMADPDKIAISIHALREEGDHFYKLEKVYTKEISIHALREEGDPALTAPAVAGVDFYPRPPRGGRRLSSLLCSFSPIISIHALREEGDVFVQSSRFTMTRFLSTPSARRATLLFFHS